MLGNAKLHLGHGTDAFTRMGEGRKSCLPGAQGVPATVLTIIVFLALLL